MKDSQRRAMWAKIGNLNLVRGKRENVHYVGGFPVSVMRYKAYRGFAKDGFGQSDFIYAKSKSDALRYARSREGCGATVELAEKEYQPKSAPFFTFPDGTSLTLPEYLELRKEDKRIGRMTQKEFDGGAGMPYALPKELREFKKESKEHPSLSKKAVQQIVADHRYKAKLERCVKKVKKQTADGGRQKYNPWAICKSSVRR
jgi:hypothetical protein